jgi:peptide/nickel transport system permease protein
MLRFILRRLAFTFLVLVFIVFAVHLGMAMTSNSDVREPNFDLVAFSKTSWSNTRLFFSGLQDGDLGTFPAGNDRLPVTDVLGPVYINSMGLLLVSLFSATILGLILGIAAALRRRASLPVLTVSVIGISAPSFFVALLLQQAVIRYTAQYGRLLSVAGFGWDYEHMLLPVLVLGARPLAYLTRATFISLGQVMGEDYIRTAFAKGLRLRTIVNIHALRNVAVPVLTAIGVSLRFSLASLPVVELFFAWPGMGSRLLEAISERQTALVVALALALGLTFQLVNLLLDILYRLVDPRVREAM